MPKPNYAFEKRQRELEKKRKKAEKAASKKSESADNAVQTPLPPVVAPTEPR
jgi:hypothetical protein